MKDQHITDTLLPSPFSWVAIPGKHGATAAHGFQGDAASLTIPTQSYWMAKYPITNAQFAKFIEADGYNQRQWWTDAGWEAKAKGQDWDDAQSKWIASGKAWTQPRYWKNHKWNNTEHPVVGVSWYEAVAFCLWLSAVMDENITLPTENQWLYAAQGDDGRHYPWGDNWDCNRCNNAEKPCQSELTTPVRHYEGKGDSPFGVVDMAGNVWEWCLTDYHNGINAIHSDALARVLRGGSWLDDYSERFRCVDRIGYDPQLRLDNWGFRISRL